MSRSESVQRALPNAMLVAKRRAGGEGIDGWYPYYAGFSSQFAGAVLVALRMKPGSLVADPWNGSGTTTAVAAGLGFDSIGLDLNPVAATIAASKLATFETERMAEKFLRETIANARDVTILESDDPLLSWFAETDVAEFRSILHAIMRADTTASIPEPRSSFLICCLLRALRERIGPPGHSRNKRPNPTWVVSSRAIAANDSPLTTSLCRVFHACLPSAVRPKLSGCRVALHTEDARLASSLRDSSVDVVLTSPPYLTRIDYAVTTRVELAALYPSAAKAFSEFRASLMGTTSVRERALPSIPVHWPNSIKTLVGTIHAHSSYASSTYYYKNIWQYFDDAVRAIGQIKRSLVVGGLAMLIVQTSYYKEIEIDLPVLIGDIGTSLGLKTTIAARMPVGRVMTSINTRARQHLPHRSYSEAVVIMERS